MKVEDILDVVAGIGLLLFGIGMGMGFAVDAPDPEGVKELSGATIIVASTITTAVLVAKSVID